MYIQPPDEKGRLDIIKILTRPMPLSGDVNLKEIAVATKNYSGADLVAICRESAVHAMQNDSAKIGSADFAAALKLVKPSITKIVDEWYGAIKENISYAIPKQIDKTFYG